MSQQAGLAKSIETADASEQPARPKVMRRPTHFSSKTAAPDAKPNLTLSVPQEPTPDLAATTLPATVLPSRAVWQDDARFGAVMLAVVLFTNIALILWLPHVHRVANPPVALVAHESSAPSIQPDNTPHTVTLYTSETAPESDAAPVTEEKTSKPVHVLGETSHMDDAQ